MFGGNEVKILFLGFKDVIFLLSLHGMVEKWVGDRKKSNDGGFIARDGAS